MKKPIKTNYVTYIKTTPGYIVIFRANGISGAYLYKAKRHAALMTHCSIAPGGTLIPRCADGGDTWAMRD